MIHQGTKNFTDHLKAGLDSFGEKHLALGGVFKLSGSPMHIHIMNSFPTSETTVQEFIKTIPRFEISSEGLVNLVTVVSGSTLRPLNNPHTHCFGTKVDQVGGHYHYDTKPETAAYTGYFVLASKFVHVERGDDPPEGCA